MSCNAVVVVGAPYSENKAFLTAAPICDVSPDACSSVVGVPGNFVCFFFFFFLAGSMARVSPVALMVYFGAVLNARHG